MAFYFTCPFCLHKTLVDESLGGQRGPCVGCGKEVAIPIATPRRAENIAPAEERKSASVVVPRQPRLSRSAVKSGIFIAAAVPVLMFGIWMLAPRIVQLKKQRDISACKQNLRRIARALNAYAADYGTYPPPVTRDAAGTPMHSWRILILPYLGEKRLYGSYDFSKPWSSPENSSLQARIPSVFVSPANNKAGIVGESSYMLITGPRTLFPSARPIPRNAIGDGSDNTLLVVETNNATLSWTDPSDLDVTVLPGSIGVLGGIGGSHAGGATVAFADGEVGWLPSDTTKSVIDGLISPNGGEAVRGSWFR